MADRVTTPGERNVTAADADGSGPVAELSLSAEDVPLAATMSRFDDVEFEVERLVVRDEETVTAVLWTTGAPLSVLERGLVDDPSVGAVETLADTGDERLLRLEWVADVDPFVRILDDGGGIVMSGTGGSDGWNLRVLFPEHDALGRAMEFVEDGGVSFDVRRVYDLSEGRSRRYGLTDCQAETLLTAFESGYFEVPRERTLDDVADELDISHQALSERIRRAHETLIAHTLADDDAPTGE